MLTECREPLGRELRRCQDQLELVRELSKYLTGTPDPDAIQAVLLRRYGAAVQVDAVYLDRAGCCMRIAEASRDPQFAPPPEGLRNVMAEAVEHVRRGQPPVLVVPAMHAAGLDGAHVLLGALPRTGSETAVVVALRKPPAQPFDASDVLAAEAVLAHGAQVLDQVLTVRDLQRTALETVCTLVNAIDAKDNYTSAHSERVGAFAQMTGQALGLGKERLQTLEWAGLLHDVGKIGVPEQILNKPGALTSDEFAAMRKHAQVGFDVLQPVAQFEPMLQAVLHHHENHDGSGYPAGLRAAEIPLDAQIIHVVDIFDALTTDRPYRRAYDFDRAAQILQAGAGCATDPAVTQSFVEALRRYRVQHPAEFRARFGAPGQGDPAAALVN